MLRLARVVSHHIVQRVREWKFKLFAFFVAAILEVVKLRTRQRTATEIEGHGDTLTCRSHGGQLGLYLLRVL